MPLTGFQTAIPATKSLQAYTFDLTATGNGTSSLLGPNIFLITFFPIHDVLC
jgi:hypothetical protein